MATPASHRRAFLVAARVRAALAVVVIFMFAVVGCVKLGSPTQSAHAPTAPLAVAPTPPTPPSEPASASPSPSVAAPPQAPRYAFPVPAANATYAHTHELYPAADILAPCGSPVVAATDGTVLEVNRVDRWDPATDDGAWRGGRFLSILGDDGVRYYGGHLSVINADLVAGSPVAVGQSVGQVGTTGKSGACHLHFGISPPCESTGDWWNRRGVIWPWPYLDAWRLGMSTSPVSEISGWHASHGCPTAPDPARP